MDGLFVQMGGLNVILHASPNVEIDAFKMNTTRDLDTRNVQVSVFQVHRSAATMGQ